MRGNTFAAPDRRWPEHRERFVPNLGIARHDHRDLDPGERLCVVAQDIGVAAVGSADEEHDVGPVATFTRRDARTVELPAETLDHPGTGRQRPLGGRPPRSPSSS